MVEKTVIKHAIAWLAALAMSVTLAEQDQGVASETFFPQQLSAGDLLVHCAASSLTERGRQRQKYCSGFVSGVEEVVRLLMQASHEPVYRLCVPQRATAREFRDAYLRYAGRRATDLNRPAALVVVEALADAYPCVR